MATATLNVYFRTRRMWLPRFMALTGSVRLFAWAIRQVRLDTRTSERRPWEESRFRLRYDADAGRIQAPWGE